MVKLDVMLISLRDVRHGSRKASALWGRICSRCLIRDCVGVFRAERAKRWLLSRPPEFYDAGIGRVKVSRQLRSMGSFCQNRFVNTRERWMCTFFSSKPVC